jgi:hypothetical protein
LLPGAAGSGGVAHTLPAGGVLRGAAGFGGTAHPWRAGTVLARPVSAVRRKSLARLMP